MSKTIEQEGWIVQSQYSWEPKPRYAFVDYQPTPTHDDTSHRVPVMPYTLTFTMPDDFDPVPSLVAAVEAEKVAALAAYQEAIAKCNERLSRLQAITYEPEEA